jgi:hypothetical protein
LGLRQHCGLGWGISGGFHVKIGVQNVLIQSSVSNPSPFLHTVEAGQEHIDHDKDREHNANSCSKDIPTEGGSGNDRKWLIKIGVTILRGAREEKKSEHPE